MSVVLKDCQNGKILLLSKGADEAILPFARAGKVIYVFCSFVFYGIQLMFTLEFSFNS